MSSRPDSTGSSQPAPSQTPSGPGSQGNQASVAPQAPQAPQSTQGTQTTPTPQGPQGPQGAQPGPKRGYQKDFHRHPSSRTRNYNDRRNNNGHHRTNTEHNNYHSYGHHNRVGSLPNAAAMKPGPGGQMYQMPNFNPAYVQTFQPQTFAGPYGVPPNAMPFVPPKPSGQRVVIRDSQGNEVSDLHALSAQRKHTQGDSWGGETSHDEATQRPQTGTQDEPSPVAASTMVPSAAAATQPAPVSSTAAAAAPASAELPSTARTATPEFQKAAPALSDAAQKMREMIAKRLEAKAKAEGKEVPKTEEVKAETKAESPAAAPVETQAEPKAEPKAEPQAAAKVEPTVETSAEPATKPAAAPAPEPAAEATPKPQAEASAEPKKPAPGKWLPPHLRGGDAAAKAQATAKKLAEREAEKAKEEAAKETEPSQTEAKAEPEFKSEEAKPEEAKPEVAASTKTVEEAPVEQKAEPKEDEEPKASPEERFFASIARSRPMTPAEIAAWKYPTEVLSRPTVDGDNVTYKAGFLVEFRNAPRAYYSQVKRITGLSGFESGVERWSSGMTSGRGGSNRGVSRSASSVNFSNRNPQRRDASIRGGRNSSRRKGDRSGGSRRDRDEPQINLADLPPLHTVENAWKPSFMKTDEEKRAAEEEDGRLSPEEVQRKVKSLLNKLAWENFDKIAPQIREIALQSCKETNAITLRQIVQLIFEKATDEAHWSEVYANLFFYLHVGEGLLPDDIVDLSDPEKPVRGLQVLRRYLLSMAQKEFEKGWADAMDMTGIEVMSDEYYKAVSLKRRGLGLIQFIGELYKTNLISRNLVTRCVVRLGQNEPTEDVVESMVRLVKTVAPTLIKAGEEHMRSIAEVDKQLDEAMKQCSKLRGLKNSGDAFREAKAEVDTLRAQSELLRQPLQDPRGLLEKAMSILTNWRVKGGLPARLRFQIMDIEDLAKKGWVGMEDNGPKTIAQVHLEAEAKALEAEKEKARSSRQGSRRGDFRSASGRKR